MVTAEDERRRIDTFQVVYLCDGKACGEDHDCGECRHTRDIRHAANFERVAPDMYMEKERD